MCEEVRYQLQGISELNQNNQLPEPAAIRVTFRRNDVQQLCVRRHDGRFFEWESLQSSQQLSIWMPTGDSVSIRTLARTLEYWTMTVMGIPDCVHEEIVEQIASIASGYYTRIYVEIEMVRRIEIDFDDLRLLMRMERIEAEAASLGFIGEGRDMIPATESSIDALERLVFLDDLGGATTCTVCMEELQVGVQAIRLPCFHLYHQDCIVKWLQTSHFCPVCRHEMPANHQ
ncbi:hypothetical protein P3X46_016368 [Hevea brasiliensis]|uniref:RING-type E3 ubiquitin transferase n=1 Tax=Hevea brasiliensis TaxID=3981 RepID=A0ABQ9M090_HEVBR|nr:NEP1-interacting protein-like 1 [Hevea brasiliensis]KAJ9173205.1 hypothetical protein P3X46_016368 [Hevea brasiliensis]